MWAENCEFHDDKFQKIQASKIDCVLKCRSKTTCKHVTWFRGMCFLQSTPITFSDAKHKEGSICGIVKGTKAGI